ncbi:GGDEF domain-containing protein [Colwellia ponticola]|uniref:diguanylate cyclase n=1 Tax=Colwellia ponticola TaxID=2304625 RepID=A0A8H2PKI1_9GAMM|nr:GGDEF domain-containing protein [Colwellia ponticola]TMM46008.1 GGDEF domain-containing protein [Colwellia ponticola]
MSKRTEREIVLLYMSALTAAVISPFVLIRFLSGDIVMAIADAIIVILMSIFFLYVYKTHKVALASLLMSLLLIAIIIAFITVHGLSIIYWYYPLVLAIFYLNHQRTAIILCVVSTVTITLLLYPTTNFAEVSVIFVSMLLTSIFSFVIFRSYKGVQAKLKLLATTDPLTSTGNRRALDSELNKAILSQERQKKTMCLILLDLDNFKKINDTYGHLIGDDILVTLTKLLVNNIRMLDTLYRYGGEEFIIAPLYVDLKTAAIIAEDMRAVVEEHVFTDDISMTLSLGVAQFNDKETPSQWIARADAALYIAKDSGRNKVYLAE